MLKIKNNITPTAPLGHLPLKGGGIKREAEHLPLKVGGIRGESEHLPIKMGEINGKAEHFSPKVEEIKKEIKDLSASQKVKINPFQSLPF